MTKLTGGAPQRSHARSNRARILAAARRELGRDPEASIEDIARAAGVVRRTLYGHFQNRQILIGALAEEAGQAVEQAFTEARRPGADPATAMARMTLAVWGVGDRYRMLISLARRDLGEEGVRAVLSPAREETISILRRGQEEGVFARHLPVPVLAQALEAFLLSLVENSGSPGWTGDTAEPAATAALVAAGIAPAEAARRVRTILDEDGRTPA
ncbi:TetR/AcrR family transcriptional regulator [Spirillospora sp. CA-128828]|uniref:TetR/AcrR family transcriptional regulator n=1 Tax=Spirillospora sp. CA-128828 TaxID=3240033 RepID=UPI003D8FFF58